MQWCVIALPLWRLLTLALNRVKLLAGLAEAAVLSGVSVSGSESKHSWAEVDRQGDMDKAQLSPLIWPSALKSGTWRMGE